METKGDSEPNMFKDCLKTARSILNSKMSNEYEAIDFLRLWWSDKYRLPPNHPLFEEMTLEELLVLFLSDKIKNKEIPSEDEDESEKAFLEMVKKDAGDDYIGDDIDDLDETDNPESEEHPDEDDEMIIDDVF